MSQCSVNYWIEPPKADLGDFLNMRNIENDGLVLSTRTEPHPANLMEFKIK